jgi:hypothetical protein
VYISDDRQFTLREADQARGAIADEIEVIKAQIARLTTRKEMARMALLAMTTWRGSHRRLGCDLPPLKRKSPAVADRAPFVDAVAARSADL